MSRARKPAWAPLSKPCALHHVQGCIRMENGCQFQSHMHVQCGLAVTQCFLREVRKNSCDMCLWKWNTGSVHFQQIDFQYMEKQRLLCPRRWQCLTHRHSDTTAMLYQFSSVIAFQPPGLGWWKHHRHPQLEGHFSNGYFSQQFYYSPAPTPTL